MSGILNLLKIALEKGCVTFNYPKEKNLTPEGLRGKPEIDFNTCIGCGACVEKCPSNALSLEEHEDIWKLNLFYGRCLMCGVCEEECPVDAIKLIEEYELASKTKKDLEVELQLIRVKCKKCGEYFTTKRLIENMMKEYLELQDSYSDDFTNRILNCPTCRKKEWGEELAEAYREARNEN
ncbi:4Fe-4S binding protein [Candidatus Bathyarchaeota archaeon]|nr:4Fe-4S binding protein [Candidatus Bathyarchaeota archaeon]